MITKVFKIEGMHCVSCAINIDGELEDTDGIKEAKTNYAQQKTTVTFDPEKMDEKHIEKIIEFIGYKAKSIQQSSN